jgi:hypothetical protein
MAEKVGECGVKRLAIVAMAETIVGVLVPVQIDGQGAEEVLGTPRHAARNMAFQERSIDQIRCLDCGFSETRCPRSLSGSYALVYNEHHQNQQRLQG